MVTRALLPLLLGLVGCGSGFRQFPAAEPLWHDPDRRPFRAEPEEYFSPFYWDGANQMVFRPAARFFAVDPAGEAVNVNAMDEVPDSSWFTRRIGSFPMTPGEFAEGACGGHAPIDAAGPWTVKGAKPNGANPGFIIKAADGRRYLLKFDGVVQGPRATGADVIVSKIYWAAGYFTPCNAVTFFDRSILRIDPEATSETAKGEKVPITERDLDTVFEKAVRLPDGRYRASASLFLDGRPIGPFTYEGTRSDDPNDVIPHEDRRDLRGTYVLAAWTNHFDSREQNTLDTWHEVKGQGGYIRHNLIDFGDCLGSIWEPPEMGRRIGHSYYLDFGDVLGDLVTFGIGSRPWDPSRARFGKSGSVFAYFGVERFVPDAYKPGYPNPAFLRHGERDAAWMTRIIAAMTPDHVRAAVAEGKFLDRALDAELERLLLGRRRKILERYTSRLSPLSHPEVTAGAGSAELCARDLAVASGVAPARSYKARAWLGTTPASADIGAPRVSGERVCVSLPGPRDYAVVDLAARGAPAPLRVHLRGQPSGAWRVVGVERPDDHDPPG